MFVGLIIWLAKFFQNISKLGLEDLPTERL